MHLWPPTFLVACPELLRHHSLFRLPGFEGGRENERERKKTETNEGEMKVTFFWQGYHSTDSLALDRLESGVKCSWFGPDHPIR